MTNVNNQDFFIFVPDKNDAESLARLDVLQEEADVSGQWAGCTAAPHSHWIQIPLEGELVVYARLAHETLIS